MISMYFKLDFRLFRQLFSQIVSPLAPPPELQGGGRRRPASPLYPRLTITISLNCVPFEISVCAVHDATLMNPSEINLILKFLIYKPNIF